MPSASLSAWEDYFHLLYPGRSHEEWETLPKEDQEFFQLYVMNHSTASLLSMFGSDDVIIMDRCVYDMHVYSIVKDINPKLRKLSEDIFLKTADYVDMYFLLTPELQYPMDDKSSRASYSREDVNAVFLELSKHILMPFDIVPDGSLESKAEFIVQEIMKMLLLGS